MLTDFEKSIIDRLNASGCSCIIAKDGVATEFFGRGVSDLFSLLTSRPEMLENAFVADKVVGKGAAALMILGKVRAVYTNLISESALKLFSDSHIAVDYGTCVPGIINRQGTGPCPVESLCKDVSTAEKCLPLIANFLKNINQ